MSSYEEIRTRQNDFMYLDPPYKQKKTTYWDRIDYEQFFRWLLNQIKWTAEPKPNRPFLIADLILYPLAIQSLRG